MFCVALSFSAGRVMSRRPAATRHHFIMGAQKNTVFGPVVAKMARRLHFGPSEVAC